MSRLGNCAPCAAAAGKPISLLGGLGSCASCAAAASPLPLLGGLGNCAPCAAAAANSMPLLGSYERKGLGDWYIELKNHLKPMTPWLLGTAVVAGLVGFKLGKMYSLNLCLEATAVKKAISSKRKRKNKKR